MIKYEFPLLYAHPTKIVFLDDSKSFLRNIELAVGSNSLYAMFDDPEKCISFLNDQYQNTPSLIQRSISFHDNHGSDSLVHANFAEIEAEPTKIERFSFPTCVVVDYQMPTMNGIEFCDRLNDPNIGKILLTGVADTRTAVRAFNEGVIDRFVQKADDKAMDLTLRYANALQQDYFAKIQNPLLAGSTKLSLLFGEPKVTKFISDKLEEHGCVEHYISNNPISYIGIKANGETIKILALTRENQTSQIHYALQHNAPQNVVISLERGEVIGNFYERVEDYGEEPYPWQHFLTSAHKTEGNFETWYVGIYEDAPKVADFSEKCTFNFVKP